MGAAIVTFVLTVVLSPFVIAVARRRGVLDHPNPRSSHEVATPRGGGIAPAVGGLAGLALASGLTADARTALLVGGAGFGALGLLDDIYRVAALRRLGVQFLLGAGLLVPLLADMAGPALWRVVFGAGVVIWLVAYVNAFNFMDGINGIAAAQAGLAGAYLALIGSCRDVTVLQVGGLVICAAAVGFLPFNFPRASTFLGDVGSYFFGGVIAVVVVLGLRSDLPFEAVVAPVLLYLADTGSTIGRRLLAREVWYRAHREHVYQQLVRAGWTHITTTLMVSAIIAAVSLLGAVSLGSSRVMRVAADCAILAVLAGYISIPALISRPRTRFIRSCES